MLPPQERAMYTHSVNKYAAYHNTQLKDTELLENEGIFPVSVTIAVESDHPWSVGWPGQDNMTAMDNNG